MRSWVNLRGAPGGILEEIRGLSPKKPEINLRWVPGLISEENPEIRD